MLCWKIIVLMDIWGWRNVQEIAYTCTHSAHRKSTCDLLCMLFSCHISTCCLKECFIVKFPMNWGTWAVVILNTQRLPQQIVSSYLYKHKLLRNTYEEGGIERVLASCGIMRMWYVGTRQMSLLLFSGSRVPGCFPSSFICLWSISPGRQKNLCSLWPSESNTLQHISQPQCAIEMETASG